MPVSISSFFRAAPRGMLISVIVAFVFLNGLGVWQLYRLQWKEGLIADLARTEAMAPVPVQTVLLSNSSSVYAKGSKNAWRSVTLPPCVINPAVLIYMHSELAGAPGYRVLAACPLAAGAPNMLVDLGFVTDKLALSTPINIDSVVGRLRPYEKAGMVTPPNMPAKNDWYWRSAADIGKALNTPVRGDYFLVLDVAASNVHINGLQQGPVTAPLPNNHFDYALTWFGLGWALIGVFGSFVFQRLRSNELT